MPRSTSAVLDRVMQGRSTGAVPPSPPAQRSRRAWWRDTRVVLGLALVVGSVVLGARIMTLGEQTVSVWRATRDIAAGAVPSTADLEAVSLPATVAGAYAPAADVPQQRLARDIRAGEVLPAEGVAGAPVVRWVTLPIEPLHAPADLAPGDLVDVWSTPQADLGAAVAPELVRSDVLVVGVDGDPAGFGGEYGVVVEVAPTDAADVLRAVRGGAVDLVRVPVGGVR